MKHNTIILIFLSVFFLSCKESKSKPEVERISLMPTHIVSDSIESMMPGEMYLSGNYLLWTDPFNNESFIHVLDINTGDELGRLIKMGEGPEEFVSPQLAVMPDNRLFVYDLFANRCAIVAIDEYLEGQDSAIQFQENKTTDVTSLICLEDGSLITFTPSKSEPFMLLEKKQSFGKLPFKGDISNGHDHFQGLVRYNPYNGYLYYSTFKMPYFALYKKSGNSFKLETEELRTDDCTVKDNNLLYNGSQRGPIEVSLTADYIATVDTDPKAEPIDYFKIGRDYTKLPQTLCLYDYNLHLRKVIDIGMPILRVASSPKDNTLYLLSANPEFILYRIEL